MSLVVGAAASAAALWGYYRELPSWLTGPEVCTLEGGGCAALFRTSRAALLGVPNASLGVLLYLVLAFALATDWPPWLLLLMVLPAVAMSVFLGWSLFSRGLQCRICWAGHFANFALLGLILIRATAAGA
ncbi:MAG: vitamin K epoxide reductase family protein [Vicinamibacterales bacterium]